MDIPSQSKKSSEGTTNQLQTQDEYRRLAKKTQDRTVESDNPVEKRINKAKRDFDQLKNSYEKGNERWKKILTHDDPLRFDLASLYLGLKPLVHLTSFYDRDGTISTIQEHVQLDGFKVINNIKNKDEGFIVYSEENIKKVFDQYPDHFSNYPSGASMESYLPDVVFGQKEPGKEMFFLQRGLLYGFPLESSKQYNKCYEEISQISDLIEHVTLSEEEKALVSGYCIGNTRETRNTFRDNNQKKLEDFFNEKFPNWDEDTKKYLLNSRDIRLHGFAYLANPHDKENKDFFGKVHQTYEDSGYNRYFTDWV